MQRLNELLKTYNGLYEILIQQNANEQIEIIHLNEAFFILCWGVVDNYIDDQCRFLINSKQSSPTWEERRAFDIYNVNDTKLSGLSLLDKITLLINKNLHKKTIVTLNKLYKIRNRLAHGKINTDSVDLALYNLLATDLPKAITL